MTEDEMVGWHHRLHGHEFEQAWKLVMNREAWHTADDGVTYMVKYTYLFTFIRNSTIVKIGESCVLFCSLPGISNILKKHVTL